MIIAVERAAKIQPLAQVGEGLLEGSITELTAVLTAIWASDFGAVTMLMTIL
jgi:hypothetical protein